MANSKEENRRRIIDGLAQPEPRGSQSQMWARMLLNHDDIRYAEAMGFKGNDEGPPSRYMRPGQGQF